MQFKAFTLIESLVAMTILSIVVTISFMTVEWVLNSTRLPLNLRAKLNLEQVVADLKVNNRYFDETIEVEGFLIKKMLLPVAELKQCYRLELTAYDEKGTQVGAITRLVILP